jgi:branched-subunit amino acid aminotransferase/4-amino-4-deoxychorismate lyase
MTLVQIDGEPASVEALAPVRMSNYGAFTSMQVEDGAVRGLDLHLDRLEHEALTLFGVAVPEARLRERMRAALAGQEGRRSLRVQLFLETITLRVPDAMGEPSVLTVMSDPVSEGSIWNIGFVEDGRIVWPKAPMLRGVGQRLLENGLDLVGLDSETRPMDRTALAGFRQAFICNSATPACPVGNIDGRSLDVDPGLIDRLQAAWASNAPQTI